MKLHYAALWSWYNLTSHHLITRLQTLHGLVRAWLSKCLWSLFHCTSNFSTEKLNFNPTSLPKALPMVSWWCCLWFMWPGSCIICSCRCLLQMQTFSSINKLCPSFISTPLDEKKLNNMQNTHSQSCNHTYALFLRGEMLDGVCFLTCHDWRASFMMPDRNGEC